MPTVRSRECLVIRPLYARHPANIMLCGKALRGYKCSSAGPAAHAGLRLERRCGVHRSKPLPPPPPDGSSRHATLRKVWQHVPASLTASDPRLQNLRPSLDVMTPHLLPPTITSTHPPIPPSAFNTALDVGLLFRPDHRPPPHISATIAAATQIPSPPIPPGVASMAATDLPQPGDGAYLARPPQPGDGAYLMSSSGSVNGTGAGARRQGDRRRNNNGNRSGRRNGGEASAPSTSTTTADASSISGPMENLSINGHSSADPSQPSGSKQSRNRRNGEAPRRRNDPSKSAGDGTASGARTPKFQPNPSAPAFEPGQAIDFSKPSSASTSNAGPSQERRRTRNNRKSNKDAAAQNDQKDQKLRETKRAESPAPKVSSRRAAFEKGTKLTTNEKKEPRPRKQHAHQQPSLPEADDLNSRLTRGLAKKPYIECPIVSISHQAFR